MSVADEINQLNAGWYNVVNRALDITNPNFQLAQGTLGLQTSDSSGLFLMLDAVPPSAAVHYYDPSGLSKRSSAYQGMLNALTPEQAADLRTVLSDQYAAWIAYKNDFFIANPTSDKTQEDLFTLFANQRLDPGKAAQALTVYKQNANNRLNQALDALHAPAATQAFVGSDGTSFSLYRYSATIDGAKNAILTGGGPTQISYDSSTADTTLRHTTVKGAASGFWDIFSGGAGGGFDQLNTTAASSRFTVSGTINKFATLAASPIEWFSSNEYSRAYNGNGDANIWNPLANVGNWDSFFKQPDGSLARRVTSLLLVSGYDITVTSHASYSTQDYQQITTEASFGIWPFFSAEVSTTHTTNFTHNEDGTLTIKHTLGEGLIEIWGVFVAEAPN